MIHNIKNNDATLCGGLRVLGSTKKNLLDFPLVSVVTSVLNDVENIKNILKSVRQQTYTNIEYLIIDGGSKDGTVDFLIENSNLIDYWMSEPDKGIYYAWNKALKIAHGEWILFMGADDVLKPDAITNMVNIAKHSPIQLDYISGRTEIIKAGKILRITGEPWDWSKFKSYVCTGHTGAMHNKALYEKYGEYDTSFRIAGDYEFLLRPGKSLRAGYTDNVTASMSMGGVSNRSNAVIWETYHAIKKHNTVSPIRAYLVTIQSLILFSLKKMIKQI